MKVVPTFLKIVINNDIIENDAPHFPLKREDVTEIMININTAKICNWENEYGAYDLFCKVQDSGIYILYNEDMEELDRIEGYVPNNLIPEHDDCGDYIELSISKSGYVKNWYNKPQLDEFNVDFDEIIREMSIDNFDECKE